MLHIQVNDYTALIRSYDPRPVLNRSILMFQCPLESCHNVFWFKKWFLTCCITLDIGFIETPWYDLARDRSVDCIGDILECVHSLPDCCAYKESVVLIWCSSGGSRAFGTWCEGVNDDVFGESWYDTLIAVQSMRNFSLTNATIGSSNSITNLYIGEFLSLCFDVHNDVVRDERGRETSSMLWVNHDILPWQCHTSSRSYFIYYSRIMQIEQFHPNAIEIGYHLIWLSLMHRHWEWLQE